MGLFDRIKALFGDDQKATTKIDESALGWAELLWEPVKSKLQEKIDIKMSIPKGKAYALCPSVAHKGIIGYVITYSIRDNQACVRWEVPNGETLKDIIETIIAGAPAGHSVRQAVASPGKRDKNKWVWSIVQKAGKDDNELIDWYSETLAACYAFLEVADFSPKDVSAEDSTVEDKNAKEDVEDEFYGHMTHIDKEEEEDVAEEEDFEDEEVEDPIGECELDNVSYDIFADSAFAQYLVEDGASEKLIIPDTVIFEGTEYPVTYWGAGDEGVKVVELGKNVKYVDALHAGCECLEKLIIHSPKGFIEWENKDGDPVSSAEECFPEANIEYIDTEAVKTKERAEAYMEGELPGVFTLKDGRKICFSQGNLQFNCNNHEFKFSDEQNEKLYRDWDLANWEIEPNEEGWIDVFGWGTSGYMGCQPTECSLSENDYGPATGNLTGENANYDWGIYNPISNGGNKKGLWRTPSMEEFRYILEERPNAAKLKFKCRVCRVSGLILLPDDFENNILSIPIDFTTNDASINSLDADQWQQLESLGCVFITSSYWLSDGGSSWAYRVSGFDGKLDWNSRYMKFYVRLVKDIK